jgi:hypothetical protein
MTKVLNAYGGRKGVLYAMMHSPDNRPATGTPAAASRNNRNERLAQLVAFSGQLQQPLACAPSRTPCPANPQFFLLRYRVSSCMRREIVG